MFGAMITTKWFVTYELKGVTYYLASSDPNARNIVWSQQQQKALKFDSSSDAEKVKELVRLTRKKNKKAVYKVR